jgi:spermidine/putrescine transport system substrate-binding protein
MKRLFVTLLLFAALAASACGSKITTLNLLVWEGYADPAFVRAFEESHHCKVSASYMGSSDELVAKLRGGSAANYDVISPSSDVATMIATTGLAAPLDLAKIPAYSQLAPQLTSLPLVKSGGKVYGVPFTWGPNPLLYDTSVFQQPPASWAVLWDPKYRGKISVWDDLSTVYMAAQLLGYDKPDPGHLYNLSDDELEKVKAKLLELKPNVRKIWSTGGELTNLFENHEIVAAMGWPLMTNQLRQAHFPIGETIPRLDRPHDDHRGERPPGTRDRVPGIPGRGPHPEAGGQRDGLHPRQSRRGSVHVGRGEEELAPGRRRELPEAHLFLAERATPRQVQRDLERGESSAMNYEF